jgi:hypothetical protein
MKCELIKALKLSVFLSAMPCISERAQHFVRTYYLLLQGHREIETETCKNMLQFLQSNHHQPGSSASLSGALIK